MALYHYEYNQAGQLTEQQDGGDVTEYTYDQTGELTQTAFLANGSFSFTYQNYTYDANGNPTNTGDVVGPDNQLTSDGTFNYTYDAVGNESTKTNIATGDKWSYGYDNKNQMVAAIETVPGQILVAVVAELTVYRFRGREGLFAELLRILEKEGEPGFGGVTGALRIGGGDRSG